MTPHPPSQVLASRLVVVLVTVVFLTGFINLIPTDGLFPATLIIDGLYGLMLFVMLGALAAVKGKIVVPGWWLALALLAAVFLALLPNGEETIGDKLLSFRSDVLYSMIAVFIFVALRDAEKLAAILRWTMRLSVGLAVFGIAQFVLRASLPDMLLTPRDAALFSYYGTDVIRSNGLIGNTIVFSTVLLLFFSLHISQWAARGGIRPAVASIILFVSIITTFSRAAMIGAVVIGAVVVVVTALRRNATKAIVSAVALVIFGTIAGLTYAGSIPLQDFVTESFLYKGVFGAENASVQGSNAGHEANIDSSIDIILEHPFIGAGIHTQSQESIHAQTNPVTTDGAVWQVLAEGGIILFVAYAIVIMVCMATVGKAWKLKSVPGLSFAPIGLLIFAVYLFGASSLLNSAFFGKPVFILFWTVFGIVATLNTLPSGPSALDAAEPLQEQSSAAERKRVLLRS